MRTPILALSLLSAAPAWAVTAAIYDDWGDDPISPACTAVGITPYATSDAQQFVAWATHADVLVVNAEMNLLPLSVRGAVADAVARGAPVIFGYWNLGYEPALMQGLGVASAIAYETPAPLYATQGGPNFFREIGGALIPVSDEVWGDGHELRMLRGNIVGYTPADTPSIAINGRVIINGWMPINFGGRDGDQDGVPDVQEVFQAELRHLGGTWPDELTAWGTGMSCPGPWSFSFQDFTPSGQMALVSGTRLGNQAIQGGNCDSHVLGVGGQVKLLGTFQLDQDGSYASTATLPAGTCEGYLQAVDLTTCRASNPIYLAP